MKPISTLHDDFGNLIPARGTNGAEGIFVMTTGMQMPELEALRNEAIFAGALDPMSLRFQIVEYDKSSGEMLGVPDKNIGFREAIEKTAGLIERRRDSHFCLQPVGFLQ
jgi:hypothetical protein